MTRILLSGVAAILFVNVGHAEPVRFARTPDISPDGSTVVFSYLGDLWLVDAKGGQARHLTMHERHDFNPIFSPDGKQIAFSSNRHGNYDVFVMPVQGGRPKRVTHDSADDHPTGWSPDGRSILFASARSTDFPIRIELFSVPATGGAVKRVSAYEGREAVYSPKGDQIAYVRGAGAWFRKGYRGSSNDDLWLSDADGTNNRRLTSFNGQDNAPQWSPDGRSLYFVSEQFGTPANVVRLDLPGDGSGPPDGVFQQLTFHKEDSVRKMRLSANGRWIVYECGPELWLHNVKDGKGRPLAIEVNADDKVNLDKLTTFTSNASEYALSYDEKHIAFVVHGEIFLMPRSGGKAKRLTEHPAHDHGLAWSPDSKRILFLSDRGGYDNIWMLEADDPDHPEFRDAHRFKVKPVTKSGVNEMGVAFSPDGNRVSFIRGGRLMTMKPDGSDERSIDAGQIFDYEWSPDSQWLCVAKSDASFASELYIVPATGATKANPARNITRFATYNGGVTWSKTGNQLAFISQRRRNQNSAYVISLHKPAASGAPASREFDWDDVHLRVRQPSPMNIGECAISNDGTRIAFRANHDGDDLWVASVDGSQVTRITNGSMKPTQIQWSRFFSSQLFFRDGAGNIQTASVSGGAGGNHVAAVPFQARMTVKQAELFQEIFAQSWRTVRDNFYDAAFHGTDWHKVRDRYEPLVAHCVLREDLYALIMLMLGELNASHLNISGNLGSSEQTTADLGLVFDHTYPGPGLKITDILKGGPADQRGLALKAGDVIVAIDGIDLSDKIDMATLLNDKGNDVVALHVASNPLDPRNRRRLEIRGGSRSSVANLMYERWANSNARRVHDLSKGTLGYIHIPNMQEAGLDRFLRQLYSDNFDKEGIVLDVRFNGGGFTHESILNYLLGKEHTIFAQRHGVHGFVLNSGDRKWTRPLTCLINHRSYSDAEIFAHAFRAHGLGKLVGQTTGGYVIGTRERQLIDGSTFRMPRIGVRTNKGVNMEKEGVVPDIAADVHPDALARGEDSQLDKAVDVLLHDVEIWRKARSNVTGENRLANPTNSTINPRPPHAPRRDD